ncbi:transporter substrate-binding domain-containing protein [Thermoactinomyces mirandus]|uniref:histidine kinase n=1 Tax=Thermoactinomyces mirandus TaxID=2756294 RepID=A0A7W1XTN8_9BACL|nr:transporter substrate-binding domain-containing protein [Thermoactinomyces mirandus]MBA4603087.1 transporter substrate-binding domain-containing protein [Thermoactinomyces mirandus]
MKRTGVIVFVNALVLFIYLNLPYTIKGSAEVPRHEKKVYRIAGDQHLPPFSYIDETGEFTGFSVELFKRIAERKNIIIKLIPMPSYKAMESLKKAEIDAILGMKYSSNMSQFLFSDPYFIVTDAIVVPKKEAQSIRTLTDLRNKLIIMQEDHSVLSMIKNVRGSQIAIALNTRDAFNLLLDHRADGLITNKWTAAYYLKKLDTQSQYEILNGLTGTSSELTAVIDPNEQELLEMINTALEEMKKDGEYVEIHSQWFGSITEKQLKELKFLITVLIVFIFIILAALSVIYLWNKKLKAQVKKRTADLESASKQLYRQQMELLKADQFKETIFNNIYSGIITFDHKYNLTSINKRARSILNFKEKQVVQAEEILSLPIIKRFFAEYQKFVSLKGKEEIFSKEIELNDKWEQRSILFRMIPLNGKDQMADGHLITLTDRSEERMLEKKLALQEKMGALGRLVAGVAHEILNPLTTLKMFTDMLPKKYADPAFRDEMILHVPEAVNRMNRIVESLLGYSRRHEVKRKKFVLKDCLESIISIMRPTLKKNGVQLVSELNENAAGYGDPNQVGQIILNFMINALDAMINSTEKVMTAKAFNDDQYAYIKVSDTGCGIDPETIDHLFEPFYTTKPDGVGLGLSLCYQLAEENNGMIEVRVLDKGSEFTIKFPSVKKEET